MPNCCVVGFGAYGEIKEMWSRSTEVQCTQIKPSTIWSESFDPCAICEEAAGDNNDDDDGDGGDDHHDDDDHDDPTCESAIGVRRGEDELI